MNILRTKSNRYALYKESIERDRKHETIDKTAQQNIRDLAIRWAEVDSQRKYLAIQGRKNEAKCKKEEADSRRKERKAARAAKVQEEAKKEKERKRIEEIARNQHCHPIEKNESFDGLPDFVKIVSNQYSSEAKKKLKTEILTCKCSPDNRCANECHNRIIFYECNPKSCPCGTKCTNTKIQNCETLPVNIFLTAEKGWGVKTPFSITAESFIIEYVGSIVKEQELQELTKAQYANDVHHYSMRLGSGFVINSHDIGNHSRFINHSCQPNCEIQKWFINGYPRMAVFSLRDILPEEELTYDYNFQPYNVFENQRCHCKANNCRGILGAKSRRQQENRKVGWNSFIFQPHVQ